MNKDKHIIERLQEVAKQKPNDVLFRYIEDEKNEPITLTYAQVDYEARKIASHLLTLCKRGDRALMLYPAGLEFVTAFYGCLYAGLVAVPAYPPRKNQKITRLKSIIEDADAAIVMTSQKAAQVSKPLFDADETVAGLLWLESDSTLPEPNNDLLHASAAAIESTDIAFLQYTSGSTGNPKGVMVSHVNLMSNMEVIYTAFGYTPESISVSWLPHFHDMGLMGGVVEPLYSGTEVTFMAPAYFLQKPIRWIEILSKYKATVTGGPNFAYDLCVDKISDEDLTGIDLSALKIALNGAEPVHAETLRKFSEKFAKCGFKPTTHFPSYGMAETTLMLTSGNPEDEAKVQAIDSLDLQDGVITVSDISHEGTQNMVSSGHVWTDHEVIIVNQETLTKVEENIVGEVWARGSSIAQGYWKNPEKTEEDFHAYISDTKEGPYLRTGDLAFLHEKELYITGRAKDLLIIRGRNYYPQDIELAVGNAHEAVALGNAAAFSLDIDDKEQLVIVQEIQRTHMRKFDEEAVLDAMIETIAMDCELQVYDIVLVRPGQVLKTSSGKIQRQANKKAYLDEGFKVLGRLRDESSQESPEAVVEIVSGDEIVAWLKKELSLVTQTPLEKISEHKNFMAFGLDSLASVELQNAISEHFSIELPLVAFYDYPSIEALSPQIRLLIEKGSDEVYVKTELPPIIPSQENKYEKFELNNIQQAYLLGRSPDMTLGNTACFAYAEIIGRDLDLKRLEKAWNLLVQRHEMLRCVMHEDITQQIIEEVPYQELIPVDISEFTDDDVDAFLEVEREKKLTELPDPKVLPLISLEAYLLPENKKRIHIYVDMLVCDASSMFIILEELHSFYNFPEGPLAPIGITFKDYLKYTNEHKEGKHFEASLKYWRARLETLPSGPSLALQKQPVEIEKPKFRRREFTLNKEAWSRFQEIAASMNVTPTAVLLALYGKVLATWSNSPHFCINLTHFHRLQAHKDVNRIIGDFTSLIPLEVNIPATKTFDTYLKEVQSQLVNDLEHDDIGGVQILREMRSIGRETSMPVVFTSTLGLNDFACDWMGEREFTISQTPQVWIDNQVLQKEGQLIVNWDCIDELFREKSLDNMFQTYIDLIESVIKTPKEVVIDRYSPIFERRYEVYALYNRTATELPTEPLPQQCMKMALSQPQSEAVITTDFRMTYQELHNATAQVAMCIEESSYAEDAHVAIILPKGWEQIVSVLSCGYAGVAYLPMSIDYPKARMEYLLDEADITTVLSDAETLKSLDLPSHIRGIDVKKSVSFETEMPLYDVKAKADALAYTIFTSGSTGKPKGVMISHASVCNTVMDINQKFDVTAKDKFFGISALNFDLSVYDIYGAFTTGASLVIPDEEKRKDAADWYQWVQEEQISIWNSVPALMKLVTQEAGYDQRHLPESLRLIMLSGDFIPMPLVKDIEAISSKSCEIISLGGATEASIWSIYYPISALDEKEEKIPYGYPLANQELFVLDEALDARPYLVHGDIYIKGSGVAQGYFNDPKRTKAQFVVDPDTGEVLYKTGDIGYFNPKGYMNIVGRLDEQVKIQGYRVELGEIEQHMVAMPRIKEAVVLAKQDETKHNVLIAYVTIDEDIERDCEVGCETLKSELTKSIPDYMVPLVISSLSAMPLTANGKVDKKALLALDIDLTSSSDFIAPKDLLEKKLANIFSEVLNVEKVGVRDNFFELGGHSLLATQLVSKIRNELEVELPLKVLFTHTNVESIKKYIQTTARKATVATIDILENREELPLSFAQERLWFIDQLEPNSAEYNLPVAVKISGKLESQKVEEALNMIIDRHENLRTVFPSKEGMAQQRILDHIDFDLAREDLSALAAEEAYVQAKVLSQHDAAMPFDLAEGPLVRAMLMKISDDEHILLINSHHIISDGLSLGILFRDFSLMMDTFSKNESVNLAPLRIQYADYSVWQRESLAQKGVLEEHLAYWEEELTPYPRKLNLSKLTKKETNTAKKEDQNAAKTILQTINTERLSQIDEIAKAHNWTSNQILLGLYASLIYRYTNQDSMIIAVPNANRPTSETEEIFGFFVNTMLLKFDFDYSSAYSDILKQTQEKLLSAIEHQDAPLQNIIENIRAQSNGLDMDDNFQFAFNSIPVSSLPKDMNNAFSYETFDTGVDSAKTLITLTLAQKEDEAELLLTYKDALLAEDKVKTFLNDYLKLIDLFCVNPEDLIVLAPLFNEDIIVENGHSPEQVKAVYPLTQMQSDLYLQGKINFNNDYLIGWYYAVDSDIHSDILKQSIDHVFGQIDIVNSQLVDHTGLMYQMLLNEATSSNIVEIELAENEALEFAVREAAKSAIDVDKGSAVKVVFVYKKGKLSHIAYMAHHAVMDGLSVVYLKSLIDKVCKTYLTEKVFIDVEAKTTTTDIFSLIKRYNSTQKEAWIEPLKDVGPVPIFNTTDLGKQRVKELALDKSIVVGLNTLKKRHKLSLVSLMHAVYVSTLYRLFNFTEDMVLFEPLSIRKSLKEMSLGAYIDIRPIVIKSEWFDQNLSIVALAKHIEAFQKEHTTALSMHEQSQLISNNNVIFGVNFIPRLKQSELSPLDLIPEHEVQFTIFSGKEYILRFTYPENVFNGVSIEEKFLFAAKHLLRDEEIEVLEMDFLAPKEEEELRYTFNQDCVSYKQNRSIHRHFEAQVDRFPDNIALVYENEKLTYKVLNERANQLAHYLLDKGVKADELVAICVERSVDMIVGLLAILKAGGAYLPIDPSSPKERIEYILKDSKSTLMLTQKALKETLSQTDAEIIYMDRVDVDAYSIRNTEVLTGANNLAYVIYTSGSTGNPKGVMIEHANVDRLFKSSQAQFHFNENDIWTMFHSFAFDFAVWEIWGALLHGGKLLVVPYLTTRSSEDFYVYLRKERVTILNQTPAAFQQLIEVDAASEKKLTALRKVIFGGEKLNFTTLAPWYEKYADTEPELVNMYGITETTVHVTYYALRKEDVLNEQSIIGVPLQDLSCYILDKHNKLVSKGLPGELHVAGDGLARGYLYQKELTDERFIVNPFEMGTKLYKTGDLVRYLDDGKMEYLGRIDDQVKIRGFRIELGEIEQQLLLIEGIKEAIVLAKEDAHGYSTLVGFIVGDEGTSIDEVKVQLSLHLPEYMIPQFITNLESMPLTSNGKVDKKALAALDIVAASENEYVAPRTEEEEKLTSVFEEVLGVEKVGVQDSFFDLGGHSLLSVQVISKAKALGLKVELTDLFQGQTVEKIIEISQDESKKNEIVDLEKEAVLDEAIQPLEYDTVKEDKEVLLTGATGFVGKYLLAELLNTSDVTVHCLVRGETEDQAFEKLKSGLVQYGLWKETFTPRVKAVLGDLVQEQLGIEEERYQYVCENVDRIYHCAAYLNPMASYDFLAEVNVAAIEKILRIATTGQAKPIEYISTMGIFNTFEASNEETPIETQKHLKSDGYGATKFLAEKIILMAIERGIHTNIYRLGLIVGDNKLGKNDESQWFHKLLNACIELKSTPDVRDWVIPFTPVDFVARSVVTLGTKGKQDQVYHLTTPFSMRFMDLVAMYNAKNEEKIETVSPDTYFQLVQEYNATKGRLGITDFITDNVKKGFETSVESDNNLYIHSFKTMNTLKTLDLKFPDIDEDLASLYFNEAKSEED